MISQARSDMHPTEYKIPLPHKRQKGLPLPMPVERKGKDYFVPNQDSSFIKDPHYSANGLIVYLHYIKDYPSRGNSNIMVV